MMEQMTSLSHRDNAECFVKKTIKRFDVMRGSEFKKNSIWLGSSYIVRGYGMT